VDRQHRVVGLMLGGDEPGARLGEGPANPLGALGQLGARGADTQPDLVPGIVQAAAVAPDDGHRESHCASVSVGRVAGMAAAASLREHGLRIGELEPGPTGGIGDVAGVRVGHVTVRRDEPDPPEGRGVARSGVTAIVPGDPGTLRTAPVRAGVAVLNGAGVMTGSIAVAEWGVLETPVYLTATMAVGRVFDGAVAAAVAADPAIGVDAVVVPVVAECDDSWLSEARVVQVEAADAGRALEAATPGPVE
jgi:Peptidase family S58